MNAHNVTFEDVRVLINAETEEDAVERAKEQLEDLEIVEYADQGTATQLDPSDA